MNHHLIRHRKNSTCVSGRSGRVSTIAFLAIAVCALVVVIGISIIPEVRAKQQFHSILRKWQAAGLAVDRSSYWQKHPSNLYSEGAADWRRILSAAAWGSPFSSVKELPVYWGKSDLISFCQSESWPDDLLPERLVTEYLDEMQPLIESIRRAPDHPKLSIFSGYIRGVERHDSLAYQQFTLARLLELECLYAVFLRDGERCLRGVEAMDVLNRTFDGRGVYVDYFYYLNHRQRIYFILCCAVARDVLSDEQLSMVKDRFLEPIITASDIHELLRLFASMEAIKITQGTDRAAEPQQRHRGMRKSWSRRVQVFEILDALLQQEFRSTDPIQNLACNLSELIQKSSLTPPDGQVAMEHDPIANLSQITSKLVEGENLRKLARCAIYIRQYARHNQTWPTKLDDLQTEKVSPTEYQYLHQSNFGFRNLGDHATLYVQWSDLLKPLCSLEPAVPLIVESPTIEFHFR